MNKFTWFVVQATATAVSVLGYKNASLAKSAAEEFGGIACTDGSMKDVPTSTLVLLHNTVRPEKPVTKFSDRETAEKRVKGVLEVLAKAGKAPSNVTKSTSASGERVGRTSAFAGKVIIKLTSENPRREGTWGFKSWAVLRSGMTYEAYVAAGGRRQDLAWDLDRKRVKLEDAPKKS